MKKIIILVIVLSMCLGNITFAQEDEPSGWAIEIINELQNKELLRSDSFMKYQDNITRGEFIYLAVRIYEVIKGEEIVVDDNIQFTDTDDIYARKGATVKITSGIGNNQFGYNQLLTREQLATLMVNVITLLEVDMKQADVDKFTDDDEISSWAKDAIYKARENNIISGVGNNRVNPKGNASVQVALVITCNILNEYHASNSNNGLADNIESRTETDFVVRESVLEVRDGKLAIPLLTILKELGVEYSYEGNRITSDSISLEINNPSAKAESANIELNFAPYLSDNEIYVPLSLLGTICNYSWNGSGGILTVQYIKFSDSSPNSERFQTLYTQEYLQKLVDNTEVEEFVTEFRNSNNPRRNGLGKVSGKYFDMYYPNDEKGQATADLLAPHMDKVYVMLMDMYNTQAKVEVHLIHEEDAHGLMEGKIRAEEFITYIWIEEGNDGKNGLNNIAEFVHEVNHNFFSKVNNGATNTMWINEAHAKLVASLYTIDFDYHDDISQYEYSIPNIDSIYRNSDQLINLEITDSYLEKERAWGMASGDLKKAQSTGIFFWQYIFHHTDYDTFKHYLQNLGTADVLRKIEELTGKDISYFNDELKRWSIDGEIKLDMSN